jgi:hypothetical protein
MRRRLALLTTCMAVALGAAIVNPAPAPAATSGASGESARRPPGRFPGPKFINGQGKGA